MLYYLIKNDASSITNKYFNLLEWLHLKYTFDKSIYNN